MENLRRSIVIFWVKVLKTIFPKGTSVQIRSFMLTFICPSACSKGFYCQKAIFCNRLPQLPWYRWTNLGTSFHKYNSNVLLQFPFRSANLLELSFWFSASVDFQVFDSAEEILKRIASSLWSICWSARTCGASATTWSKTRKQRLKLSKLHNLVLTNSFFPLVLTSAVDFKPLILWWES